jgi:hypothetical protein
VLARIWAARYVVPEKRSTGPFAPLNITRFYRSLTRPLKLTSVEAVGRGTYEARYSFIDKSGRSCDGRSIVTTIERDNSELIWGVKALNGC